MIAATDQFRRWKNGVVFAAIAVAGAALIYLWAVLQKAHAPAPLIQAEAPSEGYTIQWVEAPPPAELPAVPTRAAMSTSRKMTSAAPVVVEPGESAWEQHIAAVLADTEHTESVKAQTLLAMLPLLPEELLQGTTQAAADRLRDEDYAASALPLLLNAQTHGMIASALFADLMERPDAIALPSLLAITRTPDHPFAAAARSNLEMLLGRDLGEDWSAWSEEIQRRLAAPQN